MVEACITEALSECPVLRWHHVSWTPTKEGPSWHFCVRMLKNKLDKEAASRFCQNHHRFLHPLVDCAVAWQMNSILCIESLCALLPALLHGDFGRQHQRSLDSSVSVASVQFVLLSDTVSNVYDHTHHCISLYYRQFISFHFVPDKKILKGL